MMTMLEVRWKIEEALSKLWQGRERAPVTVTRNDLRGMTGVAPQVLGRALSFFRNKIIEEFEKRHPDAFMTYQDDKYRTIYLEELKAVQGGV